MNILFERYEHLRSLCKQCRPEEYAEYLLDMPSNPFDCEDPADLHYKVKLYNYMVYLTEEVIAKGTCQEMIDALYYIPTLGANYGQEILWND